MTSKRFRVTADYISTDEVDIDAETIEEARRKFNEGEYDSSAERNTDYTLNEFKSIVEIDG